MSYLDRPWLRSWVAAYVDGLDLPDLETVRAAYLRFVERNPTTPLACRVDPQRYRWVPVPPAERRAHVESVIRPGFDLPVGGELDGLLARSPGAACTDPFQLYVGDGSLARFINHGLGDGETIVAMLLALSRADVAGLEALNDRVGTGTVLRLFAADLPGAPVRVLRAIGRVARARLGPPAGLPSVPVGAGPPEPIVATVTMPMDRYDALAAWRTEHAPEASVMTVFTSAFHRVLDEAGLAVNGEGVRVLASARRFLPEQQRSRAGNLARGIFVSADLRDPTALRDAIRAASTRAAIASSMLAGSVQAARGRCHPPEPAEVGPLEIAMSWMTGLSAFDALPWRPGAQRRYAGAGMAIGPGSLTVFVVRHVDRVVVSASTDGRVVDADRLRAAVARLADPVGVLSGRSSASRRREGPAPAAPRAT